MRARLASFLLATSFLGSLSSADAPANRTPAMSRDERDLAARAQRAGDAAVIAALQSTESAREAVLEAIRETPYLHSPEEALPVLVPLAASRDPDLAPAAAFAMHRVIEGLDRPTLEAHEADVASLERVRDALTRLANDATKRADIRRLATFDAARLESLLRG